MDRRDWLRAAGVAGLGGALGSTRLAALAPNAPGAPAVHTRPDFAPDLVIRGGTLIDGSGGPLVIGDLAVTGDRITAVGEVAETGAVEIDATGHAVSPGFIDIHSHADNELFIEPRAESRIRQGVTLEIVGQDGGSLGPRSEPADWGSELSDFLDAIDRTRPAVSVATMVGHGTVRGYVMGDADRPATAAELTRMRRLVAGARAQGAVGISSGLEYNPGGFAGIDELVELAAEFAGSGYPYASHMRNEDDELLAAVEEAIQVGRRAGVPVQISHLKAAGVPNYWKGDVALRMIEAAAGDGLDIHFDRYPYVAFATGLTLLFPGWARVGGVDAFFGRLEDPDVARRVAEYAACETALLGGWNGVQISSTPTERNAYARGRRLGELAAERGEEPYQLALRLLREEGFGVGMIGFGMSEENTSKFLSHPLGMVCSDGGAHAPYGPLSEGSPHPRGYGTFPRLLGHYVRERGDMTLARAIHKITMMPADKLRMRDRGRLRVGAVADVTVFDPGTVTDRATFADPHQYPLGIPHVVVNGVLTLRDGEHTGELGGRAVRGSA